MALVEDIYDEVKKVLGTCNDTEIFGKISEAIELLANQGDWDPMIGELDICVTDNCVTLPPEVETPIAININGSPALGRDRLFSYHLNGPGDCCGASCGYTWMDKGDWPTYKELSAPAKLIAFVDNTEDAGVELWAYGYDSDNHWIRTKINGEWKDGYLVPTIYGYAVPAADAPVFRRVTGVTKLPTVDSIRLSSIDNATGTGTLIGYYESYETDPKYRRIKLSKNCNYVRILYRKRTAKIRGKKDLLPLHSTSAITFMVRSLKFYDDRMFDDATAYEATAIRWLEREQFSRTPPVSNPIQVDDRNLIHDKNDDIN